MDEIISYKMCAVKVRNAKLRNYLKQMCLLKNAKSCKPVDSRASVDLHVGIFFEL